MLRFLWVDGADFLVLEQGIAYVLTGVHVDARFPSHDFV